MRIHFVTWWEAGHYGYRWHFTEELEAELRAQGVTVTRTSGQAFQPPHSFSRIVARLRIVLEILRLSRNVDVLLLYMDSPPTRVLALLRFLGFLGHPKLVVADFWLKPPPEDSKNRRDLIKTWFLRRVYGQADLLLFSSAPGHELYTKRRLLGNKPTTAFLAIAEIDAKLELMDTVRTRTKQTELPFGEPYFFSTGISLRDFDSLLKVAKELPQARFAMMTKGDLGDDLPANVKSVEWGPFSEYLDILHGAQAVIIPMLPGISSSGLRTLHEAWGLGVPAIIGMTEGIASYLNHPSPVAYTYTPLDSESLKEAILVISQDPDGSRTLGEHARDVVRTHWSSRSYVEGLLPHLERLMTRHDVRLAPGETVRSQR